MVLPLGDPPALVTLTWGRGCGLQLGILCARGGDRLHAWEGEQGVRAPSPAQLGNL